MKSLLFGTAASLLLVAMMSTSVRASPVAPAAAICPPITTQGGFEIHLDHSVATNITDLTVLDAATLQPVSTGPWEVDLCSSGVKLQQQGAGGVAFDGFLPNTGERWTFNGTGLVGLLAGGNGPSDPTAFVTVLCKGNGNGNDNGFSMFQSATVGPSPYASGKMTYNFTFMSNAACPQSVPNQHPQIPFTTYECQGDFCNSVPSFLVEAIQGHGAPGMSAAAVKVNSTGGFEVMYKGAAGRFTYDQTQSAVTEDSLFDMASCTKVVTTTTATAQLVQLGLISVDEHVYKYLPGFEQYEKDEIKIHNLLVHNAGFPPDPNPGYSSPIFPCPENANYHPGQEFSCDSFVYTSVLNQTLQYPTGSQYIYSDLSFISLMFVVGAVTRDISMKGAPTGSSAALQKVAALKLSEPCVDESNLICWFHAYVKTFVFEAYDMKTAGFIPTNPGLTPPQWFDPWYHHSQIWGYVSDQNAYAMGGVSGHAGLFASVKDSMKLMMQWMAPASTTSSSDPSVLSAATVAEFIKVQNTTQSSRALGWDTMYDPKSGLWCGTLSKETFFHIGFTGTQLCGDPINKVFTVLLANGRYPHYHIDGMITVRPQYNELVKDLLPRDNNNNKIVQEEDNKKP